MQASQNTVSFQLVAEVPRSVDITFTPNRNSLVTPQTGTGFLITDDAIPSLVENAAYKEYMLMTLGKRLAETLARILDLLSEYNQETTYTIMSILEPYIETDRDLYARMPPKSSREVIVDVTVRGKAKPKASLD